MAYTNGMNGVSEYAQFYNSDNHDRVYDADSMAEWLTPFFVDGIFNGQMQVTANNNMTVSVAPGFGYIDGKVKHFPTTTRLNIDIAHAQYQRIDLIVLRRDDTQRDFFLDVLKGTPSQNPVAPTLTRNNTIWELQLAKITVPIGATRITQANITDTRMNKPECGWVAATVEEIDFNQIKTQFDTWYDETTTNIENTYEEWRTAFEQNADDWFNAETIAFIEWFNRMKDQLSTDAAGNLQMQIDDLNTGLTDLGDKVENDVAASITDLKGYVDQKDDMLLRAVSQATAIATAGNYVSGSDSDVIININLDTDDAFSSKSSGIFIYEYYNTQVTGSTLPIKLKGIQLYYDQVSNGNFYELGGGVFEAKAYALSASNNYSPKGTSGNAIQSWGGIGGIYNADGTVKQIEANSTSTTTLTQGFHVLKGTAKTYTALIDDRYTLKPNDRRVKYDTINFWNAITLSVLPDIRFVTAPVSRSKIAKKAIVSMDLGKYRNCTLRITNNANDSSPAWESCTLGEVHTFANKTCATTPAIAVSVVSQVINNVSLEKRLINNILLTNIIIAVWEEET